VGIDAKHSFEDNVLPVTDAKQLYGSRLSLLGGVDVDLLARGDEQTIRARTREILTVCHPGGGYCIGSGNWVTDYVPLDSYLTMLHEAQRYGEKRTN
jgi:uroporphyrinogen decarboxylase